MITPLPCPDALPLLDIIKTLASIMALPLAVFTFWLGYRQKENERTRGYYHKAVVDIVLPTILDTFNKELDRLTEAGREALEGIASNRKTMPRSCNIALASFTENLFRLQDTITERTLLFDEQLTNQIMEDFENIEDDAKAWFNDVAIHKRKNPEDLRAVMRGGQRKIIKKLYRGDFRDF